jgi:hypothetical protein
MLFCRQYNRLYRLKMSKIVCVCVCNQHSFYISNFNFQSLVFSFLGVLHTLPWAKKTLLAWPFLSVCPIFCNNGAWGPRCCTTIGSKDCNCCTAMGTWITLVQEQHKIIVEDIIVQQWPGITFMQGWPKTQQWPQITRVHNSTMTYVLWCEEHLWNVSVLQRIHLSNLVIFLHFVFVGCGRI